IKDIGRAIRFLRGTGQMAIVLVEQYFDFAQELADRFIVTPAPRRRAGRGQLHGGRHRGARRPGAGAPTPGHVYRRHR
ncbi:hypothetical protein ACIKT0_14165, partial [Hansschlegelia beijingensis]